MNPDTPMQLLGGLTAREFLREIAAPNAILVCPTGNTPCGNGMSTWAGDARALAAEVGPIATTSANRTGEPTPVDAAALAFERLRHNVERHLFPQVGHITVSIGFTELKAGDTPNGAFERADKAVYFAKGNGRNQLHHHADLVAAGHLADDAKIGDVELF